MNTSAFKSLIAGLVLCLSLPTWGATIQVVTIKVQGLTCPFCVYGLSKNLGKAPGVTEAEVSLEQREARIELQPGQPPDIKQYRQIILDAGFTPGDVRVHEEEMSP